MDAVSQDPGDTLRQLITGFARTQELCAAVRIGIPEQLALAPMASERLAAEIGADADALHRFLRRLAVLRIVEEREDGTFALLPMGHYLRPNHPDSLHSLILWVGEVNYRAHQEISHTVIRLAGLPSSLGGPARSDGA